MNFIDYGSFVTYVLNDVCSGKSNGASYWINPNISTVEDIPTEGYLVGTHGCKIPHSVPLGVVEGLLDLLLNTKEKTSDVLGVWVDDKYMYIDLVQHHYSLKIAMAIAEEGDEKAIFDLKHKESISLDD